MATTAHSSKLSRPAILVRLHFQVLLPSLLLFSLFPEPGCWVVPVLVPDMDPPRNDKQDEYAKEPVDYGLAPISIDFHHMDTRRLGVRHGADVPV